jgi:DNA-binding transcriptional LysR family regulator
MISLSSRALQVFVAVVDAGSFAEAARRIGISQPSISAHVQGLERETGARLFYRTSGRQATLTEAGRSLLAHARDQLERNAQLEQELAGGAKTGQSSITFACQRSLALTILRRPIANFARTRPDTRLSLRIAFQEEVMAAVRTGATDIGCLILNEEPEDIPSLKIGRQRFVVFATPDHPLAGRKRVPPCDLSNHNFIGPIESSLFGRTQKKLLASVGVDRMRIVAEGTEFSLVRDLAAAGLGLGCSIYASVEADVLAGHLVLIDLDGPPLYLDVHLLMNPQRRLAKPVRDLTEFLQETFAAIY